MKCMSELAPISTGNKNESNNEDDNDRERCNQ